ncbi:MULTISPECIES: DUF551 domain-containing protein [unclassified Acinetobacter]|uniref:DUF551 domain-containing protein n=1 Tax=unclassified Acinetobacter TaxID=196816 RepID=UPI00124CCA9D|nr:MULTISPECIES: DUF551 domain-containing protein [unclassified Acinetobacter]
MTDLNKEREVNLRFEQDDGFVWVFDGDSQFGTEISHLMMMHADEYNEDELRVICNHAACEIDKIRAELEKAKAQAVPEWISVEDKLPEIADASVLAHFQNGSIETVHIEDWFKDITSGFDEAGKQTFTKWYLKASNTITHWMPLQEAPIETGA